MAEWASNEDGALTLGVTHTSTTHDLYWREMKLPTAVSLLARWAAGESQAGLWSVGEKLSATP